MERGHEEADGGQHQQRGSQRRVGPVEHLPLVSQSAEQSAESENKKDVADD